MRPATTFADRSARGLARDPVVGVGIILASAILFGGGGISASAGNLAVQLVAIAVLALHFGSVRRFAGEAPAFLRLLVAATLALPLIQMIPLPPSLWEGLPGRDLVGRSLDLAGGRGWFPLSMDPQRTLLAALGLIAPTAIVAIGWTASAQGLIRLQRLLIALGLASALFGTLHLFDPAWGDLYAGQRPMPGILVGTFADRNAAALFYGGCLLLLAGLPVFPRATGGRLALAMAAAFLTIAVVLTGSRSGIALLALPFGLAIWRAAAAVRGVGRAALALVLVAVVAAGAIVASQPTRIDAVTARFDEGDGMRAEMRADALVAARHYWPVGSGMGTFDEVFQVDESLEYVSPRRAGRAHMDYYELAIEAGIAGLALLAAWAAWFASGGWNALRQPGAWPARAAILFVSATAAQSLLSFPLRNQSMLCAAAVAVILLARSPTVVRRERSA